MKDKGSLRKEIANLEVYMPHGEPKRFAGTGLADQILAKIREVVEGIEFHYNVSTALEKAKGFEICRQAILKVLDKEEK